MKTKMIVTSILTCAVILAAVTPAAAVEPLPPQLEYIDAQLDVFLPKLADYQAKYLDGHKDYYQALSSHSVVPSGAKDADLLTDHPTDQDTSLAPLWDAVGLPTEIAWEFSIGVYTSPRGKGYLVNICTLANDSTWCKRIDAGPDGGSMNWYQLGKEEEL